MVNYRIEAETNGTRMNGGWYKIYAVRVYQQSHVSSSGARVLSTLRVFDEVEHTLPRLLLLFLVGHNFTDAAAGAEKA